MRLPRRLQSLQRRLSEVKGYLILNFTIVDNEKFSKYKEGAGTILKEYMADGKAKLVVNSKIDENIPKDGSPREIVQVIEFSDIEYAREFYLRQDYQKILSYRTEGTSGWATVVPEFQ